MQLYPPEKHAALRDDPWSEDGARAAIAGIVRHSVETIDADSAWPMHPLDGDSAAPTGLYYGAGGVFWAVSFLIREGAVDEPRGWFGERLPAVIERNVREQANYPPERTVNRSYLIGDMPLQMLRYVHARDAALADVIFARLERSLEGAVSELMWGLAGCMIAALHLHALTGESRWLALYQTQADRLVGAAQEVPGVGLHWRPELYGKPHDGLGAVHGLAGNVAALLAGLPHLSSAARSALLTRVPETLRATAIRSGPHANWPTLTSSERPLRVYHCHGAAGIVTSSAGFPRGASPLLDEVLLEGAELTFAAGPLRKGPSLCHGTAGNGFALLKTFARTGDERWLQRARRFAMHALWQVEASRELFSQGRHTLWTGDLGVAIFLHECIRATARFPSIDVF